MQAAHLQPLTPVHFGGSTRLEAAQVTVGLRVGAAGAIRVVLNCFAHSSEELLGSWRRRSAQVINRRKRRRDAAEAAADRIPSGICELFFARCKAAQLDAGELLSSHATQQPHGISRVIRIGQIRVRSAIITAARRARSSGGRRSVWRLWWQRTSCESIASSHERRQKALHSGEGCRGVAARRRE